MLRASTNAWGCLLLGALGCAPQAQTPAKSTTPSSSPAASSSSPEGAATAQPPRADVLYSAPDAVPAPPLDCPHGEPLPAREPCPEARDQLSRALLEPNASGLDTALHELEKCEEFPRGLVRALRAELGPPECADLLVQPLVGEGIGGPEMSPDIREALVALGLGARLRRLAQEPPAAPRERGKEELKAYFEAQLFPWIEQQASAIFSMASQGTALSGYARGVVAIEAGNADMRFVEIARAVPVSKDIEQFEEARDVYYATLDEQLEPRKTRGRNAALVGLREMSRAGVRSSPRVSEARELLSRAYGGRRVNALDVLLVPDLPPQKALDAADTIASHVPTPYAPALIAEEQVSPHLVRAHMQMGMPVGLRRDVESSDNAQAQLLLARALFENGRAYFQAADFQAAHALLSKVLDQAPSPLSPEETERAVLLRALSVALTAGPKDAAELIAKGPRFADSLGNLVILDGVAEKPAELGGRAGFNSAYLRELVAPPGAPDYWKDLASRYQRSSTKLKGNEAKIAQDRAAACRAIEKTVRKQLAAPVKDKP